MRDHDNYAWSTSEKFLKICFEHLSRVQSKVSMIKYIASNTNN